VQLLLDPYVLLGLSAIQPILVAMDTLCVFAQQGDNFICHFVAALKICKWQLYSLYVNKGMSFGRDEFRAFSELLDYLHESIHLRWVADLNSNEKAQLAFVCGGKQFFIVHDWRHLNKALLEDIIGQVKA
jgi:hypothetical protein